MGGKSKAPAPDPQMGQAALRQIGLAEDQWRDYQENERPWIKSITDEVVGISRRNSDSANALSEYQRAQMKRNDDRWWGVGVPFEDALIKDVQRFDSDDYKQSLVNNATADVQAGFTNAEGQQNRALMRMGGPRRLAAGGNQIAIAKASALSAAANKTRMAADQIGLSTKMQMYGGMKGLAGLGATNAGLATSAIGTGQNAAGGMGGAAGSYLAGNNAAFGSAMGGMSAGISGMGQYTQLQQNAAQINNANDPFSTILGAAAGIGTKWALGKIA